MERAALPRETRQDSGAISKAIMEKVSGNSRAYQEIKDPKYKTEIGQLSRKAIKILKSQDKGNQERAGGMCSTVSLKKETK